VPTKRYKITPQVVKYSIN